MKSACPLPPRSAIWAYFRDSGGEGQERSVAQQLDVARQYAARHGLHLTNTYADEARPASSTVGREALNQLLSDARRLAPDRKTRDPNAPAGILFWDTRRLGRDQIDNAFIKADLRRRAYILIFLSDDIPASAGDFTPVIEAFLDWKAEQDLKDIAKDAQRGLQDLAKKGFHPGGFPPRGYRAERVQIGTKRNGHPRYASRWIPDPDTAPLARRAWQMRAAGASYSQIQEAIGLYKNKNCWTTFFKNRTYLGILKCGKLEIPNAHDALCTPEEYAAVQVLNRTNAQPKPWKNTSDYLLSGMIVCGYCGDSCVGGKDTTGRRINPYRYYICGRLRRQNWEACQGGKIDANALEQAVLNTALGRVLTLDYMRGLFQQLERAYSAEHLDEQLADVRAQLARLTRAIDALLNTLEQAPSAALGHRLVEREQQRDLLLAQAAALEIRRNARPIIQMDDQALSTLIDQLRTGLNADTMTRRQILSRFIAKIVVTKESGHLELKVPDCAGFSQSTPGGVQTTNPRIILSLQ